MDIQRTINEICEAFSERHYPGDDCLVDSYAIRDEELLEVENDFKGQAHWQTLPVTVLAKGEPLSFLSDVAYCFYLPAYLVGHLKSPDAVADPIFHLTFSFQEDIKDSVLRLAREFWPPDVNRHLTYLEWGTRRHESLTSKQCKSIVAYLNIQLELDPYAKDEIEEALLNFWWNRAGLE